MKKLILVAICLLGITAFADVTVVYLSANAKVDSVVFGLELDGGVSYIVCGHVVPQSSSPVQGCTPIADVPIGATQTAILNIFSGAALNQYKNTNGL